MIQSDVQYATFENASCRSTGPDCMIIPYSQRPNRKSLVLMSEFSILRNALSNPVACSGGASS